MLSFAMPWLFGMSVAAALVVAGLHLLSVRTPPPLMLPTARFVPGGDARAVARQPRPNDVLLMLMRIGALLCAGAALAGVQWHSSRASTLKLVIADAGTTDTAVWRDSVATALGADDTMVDVVFATGMTRDPGVAVVTATRRAAQLVQQVRALSQVELTVVLAGEPQSLAGFEAWREEWPGAVRVVSRTDSASTDSIAPMVQVQAGRVRDDVVTAAFAGAISSGTASTSRLVQIQRDDRIAAVPRTTPQAESLTIEVHWPRNGIPVGWRTIPKPDSVGALVSGGLVLVGPWERRALGSDSLRALLDTSTTTRALAWWSDGEVAVLEHRRGAGCMREAAIVVPTGSDLLQSANARGLRDALTAPCGGAVIRNSSVVALADARAGAGLAAQANASAAAFRTASGASAGSHPWWLTPVLLGTALTLLLLEWWWRRREVVT